MTTPVQPKQVRSTNAVFTSASAALPLLTALGSTTLTLTVSPKVTGDALAAGEPITVTPNAALPGGLAIAWVVVSATNTVQIGLAAFVSIASSSRSWTVVAHR